MRSKSQKLLFWSVAVLVAVATVVALLPVTWDELRWRWAWRGDSAYHYEAYVERWPNGRHASEARSRADDRHWEWRLKDGTEGALRQYQLAHPNGKHRLEAERRIEELAWERVRAADQVPQLQAFARAHQESTFASMALVRVEELTWAQAVKKNTIRALLEYTTEFPQSRFVKDAHAKRAALEHDESVFQSSLSSIGQIEIFLRDYPGHSQEQAARDALATMRQPPHIVDLVRQRKVSVKCSAMTGSFWTANGVREVKGSTLSGVHIAIDRLVPYPIDITVPAGTLFIPVDSTSSTLVAIEDWKPGTELVRVKGKLTISRQRDVVLSAVSASFRRNSPTSADRYRMERAPEELTKLIAVLQKAKVNLVTTQAAVWIVTDDVSYSDLGVLVKSEDRFGINTIRAVGLKEAAAAVKLCDEAGIDVRSKQIWAVAPQFERSAWLGELEARPQRPRAPGNSEARP